MYRLCKGVSTLGARIIAVGDERVLEVPGDRWQRRSLLVLKPSVRKLVRVQHLRVFSFFLWRTTEDQRDLCNGANAYFSKGNQSIEVELVSTHKP